MYIDLSGLINPRDFLKEEKNLPWPCHSQNGGVQDLFPQNQAFLNTPHLVQSVNSHADVVFYLHWQRAVFSSNLLMHKYFCY